MIYRYRIAVRPLDSEDGGGWPDALGVPVTIGATFVPFAITLASFDTIVLRVDRLLVRTIEAGGLVVLVGVVYVVVVLGFGETPTDATRRMLGLSLVAAIAEVHGVSVRLAENTPQGLKVTLPFSRTNMEDEQLRRRHE